MADEIKLSDNIDAEFDPLVVIVPDDTGKYASFADHLVKNGFKAEVHAELPPDLLDRPTPGAVFFVSFNLKTMDVALLARRIEQKNNVCIVFAEQSGFDTAAKLSSAKMTQTLQHPYTEKNFLMAVQTIVKKRRVQHEKDLRKQSHYERQRGATDASSTSVTPIADGDKVFKSEAARTKDETPLIFEDRVRGKKFFSIIEGANAVTGHAHFMYERRRRGLIEIRKGLKTATFSFYKSSPRSKAHSIHQKGIASESHQHVSSRPMAKDGIAYLPGAVTDAFSRLAKRFRGEDPESEMVTGDGVAAEIASRPKQNEVGESTVKSAKGSAAEVIERSQAATSSSKQAVTSGRGEGSPLSPIEERTKIAGGVSVPTWALIAAFAIGILFCLFFIYQMLFSRH